MGDLVGRVRIPVEVDPNREFTEIGIRSHGKGIFHKEPVLGSALGDKDVFWVQPDCLTFNIVFAWEQAVAVTTVAESGMIASHRFPMYRPKADLLSLRYALYYLTSQEGKIALQLGSPGGAGRNRTLSQEAFQKIAIPVPPIEEQHRIADVLTVMDAEIHLLRQYLDALKKQKRGLMQLLLTGKLRVGM
jgi:type I restriction enzyme S subunit